MALTKVTGSVLGDVTTDIDYTNSATGAVERTLQSKLEDTVSVVDFGADPTGLTDSVSSFNTMIAALSNGGTVHITSGTYLLGSGIEFTQDDLTIIMDQGAVLYQADGTQTIDSLITISGDRVKWVGGTISANSAGNATYAGRGESLRWSGDYGKASDIYFNESHDSVFSVGLFARGSYGNFDKIHVVDAGNFSIRDNGDHNRFTNLIMDEFYSKGFVRDYTIGGGASTYTYVHIQYARTTSDYGLQVVLFDQDGTQCGTCVVEFGYVSAPNMTGADLFKFAYMDSVTVRGFRGNHAVVDAHRTTMRLQQSIKKVTIDDCIFPGNLNYGPTVECDTVIKGGTVICDKMESSVGIDEIAGSLTVEDGCSINNVQQSAISIDADFPESKVNLGRINYHGAATEAWSSTTLYQLGVWKYNGSNVYVCTTAGTSAGSGGPTGTGEDIADGTCVWNYVEAVAAYTPSIVKPLPFISTPEKMRAGNITIREPLSSTGTITNRADNGSWITGLDKHDAGCAQMGDRVFLVGGDDFPPREVANIKDGDIFRKRNPSAGDPVAEYWCTIAGAGSTKTGGWEGGNEYNVNDWVTSDTSPINVYVCTTGGEAGSTAPTGEGEDIDDGECVWDYVGRMAEFKAVGSVAS